MGHLDEGAEMVKKKLIKQAIKAWDSGGELTRLKNGEVQRCSIIKYCESEDKLEWETMEKFFLLSSHCSSDMIWQEL